MLPISTDLLPLAIALFTASSIVVIARAAGARVSRRALWTASALFTALCLAVELAARTVAPVGGGALRWLTGGARSLVVSLWVSAGAVLALRALVLAHSRGARLKVRPSSDVTASEPAPEAPEAPTRREALTRTASMSAVAAVHGYVGYGWLRGRRNLRVREVVLRIPSLPRTLEGYTLAHLTDLHVGVFMGDLDFEPIIERTRAIGADAIVLTGDLLDRHPRHVPDALRMFARLRARDGVFAVLGNHDYYAGAARVCDALTRAGAKMLVNEHVVLRARDQGGIVLAGLDDLWASRVDPARRMDLDRALAGSDPAAPRVLLAHNPKAFQAAKGRVDLQLSGHTHGGQVNPLGIMRVPIKHVSGHYREGNSQLFVSNGLGFSGPPVRLSAPPEIVKILLVR